MDMKLKENKKFDLSKYKVKLIKLFKVLLLVCMTLLIFHFATNFKEYRRICIDNDIPVDKYIITNHDLEGLSNEYLSSLETSNFSSPLDSEKGELKTSINETREIIESKLASIQKKSLTEDEQVKLDKLTRDYNDIDFDEGEEYKLTKLEEINSKHSELLTEINALDTRIQVRELKQELSELIKKIDKLIDQISDNDLTSEEKSTYKSIKDEYNALDTDTTKLSLGELKGLEKDLNGIYDELSKLDVTISKRISAEEQAQINANQQDNTNQEQVTTTSNNSKPKTESSNNSKPKTESSNNSAQNEPQVVEDESNELCYQTYEEAQQVGMQTMLNDSSIQKMEVDSSNNCIKYYR